MFSIPKKKKNFKGKGKFFLLDSFSDRLHEEFIAFCFQGGIAATVSHVDFFSVTSQRLAFQIAANCAIHVTASDFGQVRESLGDLTQRLLIEVGFI